MKTYIEAAEQFRQLSLEYATLANSIAAHARFIARAEYSDAMAESIQALHVHLIDSIALSRKGQDATEYFNQALNED